MRDADRVTVQVLIDHATDGNSSRPEFAVSDLRIAAGARAKVITSAGLCAAHHGLSLAVTAERGEGRHTVLFDGEPDPSGAARNAPILSVDVGSVEAVVLSCGHWDRAEGPTAAIRRIRGRRGARVPTYPRPGMFRPRGRGRHVGGTTAGPWMSASWPRGCAAGGSSC